MAEHIIDISQNSIRAGADLIITDLFINKISEEITLKISDNGCGISKDLIEKVNDPFYTSRTTRKVGLGLAFLKQNAELSGGYFKISSHENCGTSTMAVFKTNNLDCIPLGDISSAIAVLISTNPEKDFKINFSVNKDSFRFNTKELKDEEDENCLSDPEMLNGIQEYINESLKKICFNIDNNLSLC